MVGVQIFAALLSSVRINLTDKRYCWCVWKGHIRCRHEQQNTSISGESACNGFGNGRVDVANAELAARRRLMFPGFRIRGCKSPLGMRTETDCFPDVGVLVSHGARGCVLRAASECSLVQIMAKSTYDEPT
jgi:hypothetical protein